MPLRFQLSIPHFGVFMSLLTLSLTAGAAPSPAMTPLEPTVIAEIDAIAAHLVGQMETVPHPERSQVRMTTCVVSQTPFHYDTYLYQEQALVKTLEQPYRQRLLLLAPVQDSLAEEVRQVESRAFRIEDQAMWVGLCDRPASEQAAVLEALGERVCSVLIEPVEHIYVGQTPPEGCPSNFRGAVSISNTVILHEFGMDTWDRGFDAEGNQVWGAKEDDPYQFRWVGLD